VTTGVDVLGGYTEDASEEAKLGLDYFNDDADEVEDDKQRKWERQKTAGKTKEHNILDSVEVGRGSCIAFAQHYNI
jgi:hypothetical protein